MANEFAITVASNTVQLTDERRGVAPYTVYNASGRTLRGRASLEMLPANAIHAGWVQINGEQERVFEIGGTEQFNVAIAVSADAAPGAYTFRLNMVDTANPDEGFNPGATVTFDVPEPEKEPKKLPAWLIPLVIGIVALVVLGSIGAWALGREQTIAVPDVIGMTLEEAQDTIDDVGLRQRQGPREFSNTIEEGFVVRTNPDVGATVEPETRIIIHLSDGLEPTPTPVPTNTPTPTPTVTPTPDPLADFLVGEGNVFELQYPDTWQFVPCTICVDEDNDVIFIDVFAIVTNDDLYGVFKETLTRDDADNLDTIDYADGALGIGYFVNFSGEEIDGLQEMVTEWVDNPSSMDFDWIEFDSAETLIPPTPVTTPNGMGMTARLRGFNQMANRLVTAQLYVLDFDGWLLIYSISALVDDFDRHFNEAELVIDTIKINP